jgi:hypothetical protein
MISMCLFWCRIQKECERKVEVEGGSVLYAPSAKDADIRARDLDLKRGLLQPHDCLCGCIWYCESGEEEEHHSFGCCLVVSVEYMAGEEKAAHTSTVHRPLFGKERANTSLPCCKVFGEY